MILADNINPAVTKIFKSIESSFSIEHLHGCLNLIIANTTNMSDIENNFLLFVCQNRFNLIEKSDNIFFKEQENKRNVKATN